MGNHPSILAGEIISHILTYADRQSLYHCSLLDRQISIVARPLLWRTIQLRRCQAIVFLSSLIRTDRDLGHLIQHVHLEDVALNDRALLLLMRRTPSITSVILDNGARITDQSMQYIRDYWPRLESIKLTRARMSQFNVFNTVRHLELLQCPRLLPTTFATPFALDTLTIELVDPIALDLRGLVHLRHLRVSNLSPNAHGWPPNLTSVHLYGCFDWMDQDVLPLFRSCPRLTHLTLQDGQFTTILFARLLIWLRDLEKLDLSYSPLITAQGVRRFVQRAGTLQSMTLTYCGILMSDFPEATKHCAGHDLTMQLNHLDLETIRKIQH